MANMDPTPSTTHNLKLALWLIFGSSAVVLVGRSWANAAPKTDLARAGKSDGAPGTRTARRVSDADYPSLQDAINAVAPTGGIVEVSRVHQPHEQISLASNIQLLGVGGSIKFMGNNATEHYGDSSPSRVSINGNRIRNVRIIDLEISDGVPQASPLTGIRLFNAVDVWVERNRFTKAALSFNSDDAQLIRNLKCRDNFVDLGGVNATGIYLSAQNGAIVEGNTVIAGHEGIGVYNGTQNAFISHNVTTKHRPGDGIVVMRGHDLIISENVSKDNAQSGIATQRLQSGDDIRHVTIVANIVSGNAYDGIDSNGGREGVTYQQPHDINIVGNQSYGNTRTGIFVSRASHALVAANRSSDNGMAGLFIDKSNYVLASSNKISANASQEPSPNFRAGIVLLDALHTTCTGNMSANDWGGSQDWGLTEAGNGKSVNFTNVSGGSFEGNRLGGINRTGPDSSMPSAAVGRRRTASGSSSH